ncbi:MAG: hypothetical protein LRZ97_00705 [Candidatus Pacebacteria bacterium]|nr:hypothetical protein [Candidatus Paceibacterota bacterium]
MDYWFCKSNLFNRGSKWDDIKDSDNRLIYISEFILGDYNLTLRSDREFYEQIKQHDFSQYITEEDMNKAALISLTEEKIKKAVP